MSEATAGSPIVLIDELIHATDAPGDGGVARGRIPQFFSTWARSAWADMLNELPDEEAAGASVHAGDELAAKIASVLHTLATLGTNNLAGHESRQQRRSLISFCEIWAKQRKLESIRSYQLWTCRDNDVLKVAFRIELFGQAGIAQRRGIAAGFGRKGHDMGPDTL